MKPTRPGPPPPFISTVWQTSALALHHLHNCMEISDALRIRDVPIVINPITTPGLMVTVVANHPLNVTGRMEVHMNRHAYTALAIPQQMSLLYRMVAIAEKDITRQ